MFVREKVVRGVRYHALVESYRQNGKVRQRVIVSLNQCATVEEAITKAEAEIELFSKVAENLKDLGADRANVRILHSTEDGALAGFHRRNSALRRVAKAEERLAVLRSVNEYRRPRQSLPLQQAARSCSRDCYEVEPGVWIHRPHAGCTTVKPQAAPSRQIFATCWHCQGEKRCSCIACWQNGPGKCVTCQGRGRCA